jgi:hypothetical protein
VPDATGPQLILFRISTLGHKESTVFINITHSDTTCHISPEMEVHSILTWLSACLRRLLSILIYFIMYPETPEIKYLTLIYSSKLQ